MVAVDTNILVRFLVRDEPKQAARAATLIEGDPVWISKTVLLETEWVLHSLYSFAPEAVAAAFRALGGLPTVSIEDEPAVAKALDWFKAGVDFADALHLASAGTAKQFVTFDRKLANRAKNLETPAVICI
jgi:predicted nucleic-acid-binding protein